MVRGYSATLFSLFLFALGARLVQAAMPPEAGQLAPLEADRMVAEALATEARLAVDPGHPMRYQLRKQSPRLTTTKQIVETRDGAVARLVAVNDRPLDAAGEQAEQQRLSELERNPGQQQHRMRSEQNDNGIVIKVLRMMPTAFLYRYMGPGPGPAGPVERYSFRPRPGFQPPDMESQALTAMNGEIWVDPAAGRVVRLAGSLTEDTSYGWGIFGKLNKGGWLELEQAQVGPHQWRISHVRLHMSLRIVVKSKIFDTEEQMSGYQPVAFGMDYRSAIRMLRAGVPATHPN